MSCTSSEALFEAYLDGTLVAARRAPLMAHLSRCGRCKSVLEELRVVDALLLTPREIELPPNFTFATMAEVRALPRPHASRAPLVAYLLAYLVSAWALIGLGFVLAWPAMRAFGETALDLSRHFVRAFGALGHAGGRVLGETGSLGTFVGAAILLDAFIVSALAIGLLLLRPRIAERLRW